MTRPSFHITDVFTQRKYGGNQLATFVDCADLTDQQMQCIAKEINFSETTFITSRQPRNGGYDVRIFTPRAEVDFAGHPTIGTAYVIRELLHLTDAEQITLNLRIGPIPVTFSKDEQGLQQIWMRQIAPIFGNTWERSVVAHMLGLPLDGICADFPIQQVSTGFPTLVVPVKDLATLKKIAIDKSVYHNLVKESWTKLILAFAREGYERPQALSVRVFADFYGVPEDAATGSSNGALSAYLSKYSCLSSSEVNAIIGQGYEMGRPSSIAIHAQPIGNDIEVLVGGTVVEVARGEWI